MQSADTIPFSFKYFHASSGYPPWQPRLHCGLKRLLHSLSHAMRSSADISSRVKFALARARLATQWRSENVSAADTAQHEPHLSWSTTGPTHVA